MFTQKINVSLLSFFFFCVSINAMDILRTIENLHENQKPKISKTEYIIQRQNQHLRVAHKRQMTAKERDMQRRIERKKKLKSKHFVQQL